MLGDFPVLKTSVPARTYQCDRCCDCCCDYLWTLGNSVYLLERNIYGRNRKKQPVGFQYCTHKFLKAYHYLRK